MTFSEDQIVLIKRMKEAGESYRTIGLALGKKRGAVKTWWCRNRLTIDLPPKPKLPSKMTEGRVGLAIKKVCVQQPSLPIRSYPAALRQELSEENAIPSYPLIHAYLKENGLLCRKLSSKPVLSTRNQNLRLEFARNHL